jgi:hypothetical protein
MSLNMDKLKLTGKKLGRVFNFTCGHDWGPGKTTYTFSVMFRFPLRPFSVLPAGGGELVRRGGGGSGGRNGKYIGISRKRIP